MARKASIVLAMLLFAFPVMGADDSCSKEEATVEKRVAPRAATSLRWGTS